MLSSEGSRLIGNPHWDKSSPRILTVSEELHSDGAGVEGLGVGLIKGFEILGPIIEYKKYKIRKASNLKENCIAFV